MRARTQSHSSVTCRLSQGARRGVKTLVLGSSGFLGRHLVPHLRAQGHEVTAPTSRELDLTRTVLEDWNPGVAFDRIYHLAAWTRAGEFCATHGGEQWIVNQRINTNVLAFWARRQPQAQMIAFGTSVSYAKDVPLTEDNYLAGLPIDRFYGYAMSKRMLLAGLQTLHQQFGLRYLYAIPSTLYGPGYHLDGRPLHFIYDLIRKIVRGQRHGEPVVLWGDGQQRRELIYVGDFIPLLQTLADRTEHDLYNIGAGEEYSIREFAEIICDEVGFSVAHLQFDPARYVGAKSKVLSIAKARAALEDYSVHPLRDSLRETIRWARTSGLCDFSD